MALDLKLIVLKATVILIDLTPVLAKTLPNRLIKIKFKRKPKILLVSQILHCITQKQNVRRIEALSLCSASSRSPEIGIREGSWICFTYQDN